MFPGWNSAGRIGYDDAGLFVPRDLMRDRGKSNITREEIMKAFATLTGGIIVAAMATLVGSAPALSA